MVMSDHIDDPRDYRRVVLEEFGPEALKLTGQCLKDAYQQSHVACHEEYAHEEATELLPFKRRAEIHSNLRRALAPRAEIEVSMESSEFNNIHHILIATPHVLLGVVKVRTPGEMVQPTRYQTRYAEENQLDLFPSDADADLSGRLYAVLLHGNTYRHPQQLAFSRIAFPDRKFEHYVGRSIDLMELFPDLAVCPEVPQEITQEVIAKPPPMRLKPTLKPKPEVVVL